MIRTMRASRNHQASEYEVSMKPQRSRQMNKLTIGFLLFLFVAGSGRAAEINLGVNLGYRQVKDPYLSEVYGGGFVYDLFARYFPLERYGLELSYEGGYKKDAVIGLYQEDSTLTVRGIQLAGAFRYPVWKLVPYVKFGVGYFSYKQDIESEFVRFKVDQNKWTTVVGLGLTLDISREIFLSTEVKYIPLEVQPFDIPVDLGGMRFLIGLGLRLSL